jgi:PST family polysaccharide transporter
VGLPYGTTGVAVAGVIASILIAIPSINYAGRPIGIGSTLVIRAVGPQLIGAISAAAGGWLLQMTGLAHWPSPVRIVSSAALCACIYLIVVVGLFRLTEPLRVARMALHDRLRSKR